MARVKRLIDGIFIGLGSSSILLEFNRNGTQKILLFDQRLIIVSFKDDRHIL